MHASTHVSLFVCSIIRGYVGCLWAVAGATDKIINTKRRVYGGVRVMTPAQMKRMGDHKMYIAARQKEMDRLEVARDAVKAERALIRREEREAAAVGGTLDVHVTHRHNVHVSTAVE